MQFNKFPILSHVYVIFLLASASSATLVGQITNSLPDNLPTGSISEFDGFLNNLTVDPEFKALTKEEKAKDLMALRDRYKSTRVLDDVTLNAVDAYSKARSDRLKQDRYNIGSETFAKAQIEYPDISALSKEQALEKINTFRLQSEQAAETFDPLLRDDYLFDLNREANELERRVRGRGTGILTDKVVRIAQGAVGSLLRILKFDEAAEGIENTCFSENPKFDSPSNRTRTKTTP